MWISSVRNVDEYSSIFAFLFPVRLLGRPPHLILALSFPSSPLFVFEWKPSVVDSYFQPFYGFRRLLISEFLLISPVSVRDQTFRASSFIVRSLYKLCKFLESSIVEFSTWFSSPFIQSNCARQRLLPVKPPSLVLTSSHALL